MRPAPRRLIAAAATLALAAAGAVALAPPATAASGDLLFSEYIEGSSNNKALEIYNPTTAPVDLAAAGYSVQLYFNGGRSRPHSESRSPARSPRTTSSFSPQASANAAILAAADQSDGCGLLQRRRRGRAREGRRRSSTSSDRSASIRAREWGSGLTSTSDNTLRRAADTCVGDPDGANAFDPAAGWSGFATDTFDGLGAHDADCALPPGTDPDPDPEPDRILTPTLIRPARRGLRPRRRDASAPCRARAPSPPASARSCASRARSSATSSRRRLRRLLRAGCRRR